MMRAVPLLVLLLAACAQPEAPATATPGALAAMARLPVDLGIARQLAPPERDTAPGVVDGGLVRYRMPVGHATVHLYRGAAPVPPGPESPMAQAELAGATGTIAVLQSVEASAGLSGPGQVSWVREPDFGVQVAGSPAFRCTETRRVAQERGVTLSHEYVCLTGMLDAFLKLRVTLHAAPEVAPARMRTLVGVLAGSMGRALAGAAPPAALPAEVPPAGPAGEKPPPLPAAGPLIRT